MILEHISALCQPADCQARRWRSSAIDPTIGIVLADFAHTVAAAGGICRLIYANVPALGASAVAATDRVVARAVAAAELATSLTALHAVAVGRAAQAVLPVARLAQAVATGRRAGHTAIARTVVAILVDFAGAVVIAPTR